MKATLARFALDAFVLVLMGLVWVSAKLEPILEDRDPAIPGGV